MLYDISLFGKLFQLKIYAIMTLFVSILLHFACYYKKNSKCFYSKNSLVPVMYPKFLGIDKFKCK